MDTPQFFYMTFFMAGVGLASSIYLFLHSGRTEFAHKASIVLEILFIAVIIYSVISLGEDYEKVKGSSFGLWVLFASVLYVMLKAIDVYVNNLFRQMQICKDKEFKRRFYKNNKKGA
jgi:hypothetical protein